MVTAFHGTIDYLLVSRKRLSILFVHFCINESTNCREALPSGLFSRVASCQRNRLKRFPLLR